MRNPEEYQEEEEPVVEELSETCPYCKCERVENITGIVLYKCGTRGFKFTGKYNKQC